MRRTILRLSLAAALVLLGRYAAQAENTLVLNVTTRLGVEQVVVAARVLQADALTTFAAGIGTDEPKLAVNLRLGGTVTPPKYWRARAWWDRKSCCVILPWRVVKSVTTSESDEHEKVVELADGRKVIGSLMTVVEDTGGMEHPLQTCDKIVPQFAASNFRRIQFPKTWTMTAGTAARSIEVGAPKFIAAMVSANACVHGEVLGEGFQMTQQRELPDDYKTVRTWLVDGMLSDFDEITLQVLQSDTMRDFAVVKEGGGTGVEPRVVAIERSWSGTVKTARGKAVTGAQFQPFPPRADLRDWALMLDTPEGASVLLRNPAELPANVTVELKAKAAN